MTSKQVLLTFTVLVTAALMMVLSGCATYKPIDSPYGQRQVFAVAPLRNESGTRQVDGARLADKLAHSLENVQGLDVLPVNRVLAAMQSLNMSQITSKADAIKLVEALNVDALVVGTVTTYDPYDPPKLGMAVDLYVDPRVRQRRQGSIDTRRLSEASTQPMVQPGDDASGERSAQPVSTVSAVFDAANPRTRAELERYARFHGQDENSAFNRRLYRISMDLYSEFVSHEVCARLMDSEWMRVAPPPSEDDKSKAAGSDRLTDNHATS